jgi:DHA3 family macrolide efflux protein-like MFS transporter
MIAGGILIASWGGFKNRIYTMGLSVVLCGLLAIALGLSPNFALYLAIVAALGIALPLWNAPSVTLLQTKVEPEFMGRVMSVFTMAASTMMPLGMVVFGPVADTISIDTLLIATGAAVTLLAIPMVGSKVLREAGESDT